ncbi:copper transport protein ctr4 [Lipomyces oligophaga]|uniref:copper transport protein ctr4 n=1 Tax=Lipomyces oligophaga TaxID=45792 RepID=UPI0034CE4A6F
MDMSSTVTSMAMAMSETISSMAMAMTASATSTMDMDSTETMSMSMSSSTSDSDSMDMGSSDCKISMLWNWYTIDSCFIHSGWHNTTRAKFGGSCVGVVFMTALMELLRRLSKEYDRYLAQKYSTPARPELASDVDSEGKGASKTFRQFASRSRKGVMPNVFEQAVRAFIHLLQFVNAYFVMLLAMYYNGYIIICIFIGSYLGAFMFSWEPIGSGLGNSSSNEEVTVCCG